MTNAYSIGDLIRLAAAFTVDSVATDPTTVRCQVKTPAGVVTTAVYGTDVEVVKDGSGAYHLDLSVTESGTYSYRWEGTGAAQAAFDASLVVRASAFP